MPTQPAGDRGNGAAAADGDDGGRRDVISGGACVNAMLVDVGLECVGEFSRSLLGRTCPESAVDDAEHPEDLDEAARVDDADESVQAFHRDDQDEGPARTDHDRSARCC